jgi:hypothetical protein
VIDAGPVEVSAGLAAEVQEVLEARGGDERSSRSTSLEERVGGDRRPVSEAIDAFGAHLLGGGEHCGLLVARCRDLRRTHPPAVHEHRIRERAADVDPERAHGRILTPDRPFRV